MKAAVAALSLSADAQPIGDFVATLTSADAVALGVVVVVCASVVYLFGRPLAGGYRLAQLCVGSRVPRTRVRRDAELCTRAAAAAVGAHEQVIARAVGAELDPELPLDVVVKAAPVLALAVVGALVTRPDLSVAWSGAPWVGALMIAAAAGRLTWIDRRTPHRAPAGLWASFVVLLIFALVISPGHATVPQLVGLRDAFTAERKLRDANLRLSLPVARRASADVAPGTVIAQVPAPGVGSQPFDAVGITVAKARTAVSVPWNSPDFAESRVLAAKAP